MEKIDHLKFCIERFDLLYDSVNNKSALFLAINSFLVGGLIVYYPQMQVSFDCIVYINVIVILILFVGLTSIYFTLKAGVPYLSKPDNSVLYFGSIASKSLEEFKKALDIDMYEDYINQTHVLAEGLRRKFRNLRRAGNLVILEFALIAILLILLSFNLKHIDHGHL